MANQTPLANWLYSKRSELNPRFREFNWPSQIFPSVFDFETKLSLGGIEADGRGVDPRREIALEKSVAEAIERLICKSLRFDSVGFAVAGTHDPSEHAKFETLERFYLDEHLEKRIPFGKMDFTLPDSLKLTSVSPSVRVNFYRMSTQINFYGIVCAIQSEDPKRTSLGFALSENIEISVHRAFLEALPSFAWMVSGEKLELLELPWHLQSDFIGKVEALFRDTDDIYAAPIPLPKLSRIEISLTSIPILESAPLRLARFESEKSW